MSSVIVAVNRETGRHQSLNQSAIPSDMLTHAVRDLDDAALCACRVPAGTRYGESIGAGKSKLCRRSGCSLAHYAPWLLLGGGRSWSQQLLNRPPHRTVHFCYHLGHTTLTDCSHFRDFIGPYRRTRSQIR